MSEVQFDLKKKKKKKTTMEDEGEEEEVRDITEGVEKVKVEVRRKTIGYSGIVSSSF